MSATVLIADDHPLTRDALASLLEGNGFDVVGEAGDGHAAIERARDLRPDLVLLDLSMPDVDGLAALPELRAAAPDSAVVVLTASGTEDNLMAAIRAGAAGYLLKDVSPTDLRSAIRVVAAGESLLSPAVTGTVLRSLAERLQATVDDTPLQVLTEREREVLALVGRGLSNEEIARELFLSPATARTYVSRLLSKLGARDRARLVVLAYETGLVVPGR